MALLSRGRTGKGAWLDVSMTDGTQASLSIPASARLGGEIPQQRGELPLTGMFPCYETYRCACGGYVSLGALEPWFWKNLVSRLGREDLVGRQYAADAEAESVKGELQAIFATRGRDEWLRFFEGVDVCISPVLSLDEALTHPNATARRMIIDVESPLGGTDRQLGLSVKVAGEESRSPARAPRLGEHEDEILAGLGCTSGEIDVLREIGVIRRR